MTGIDFTTLFDLNTPELLLRRLVSEDANTLFALRSIKAVNRYIDRNPPDDEAEIALWISKMNERIDNNECLYWAASLIDDAKLIGTICLWNFTDDGLKAEVGFELHPDHWGKGYMSQALEAVIYICFNRLDLKSLEAYTNNENDASAGLLRKHGFNKTSILKEQSKIDGSRMTTHIYTREKHCSH